MPLKKVVVTAAVLAATATSGLMGTAASASASTGLLPTGLLGIASAAQCQGPGGSEVFSRFGDTSDYIPAPNGTFQNNAQGWTLIGSVKVVKDTSPWQLSGPGAYALQMGPASVAISPPFCVTAADPTFRYVDQSSLLSVFQSFVDFLPVASPAFVPLYSWSQIFQAFTPTWTASTPNPILIAIPAEILGLSGSIRLMFVNGVATTTLADVYIDPWARRA